MKKLKYSTRAVLLVLLMFIGAGKANAAYLNVNLSTNVSTAGIGQEILLIAQVPAYNYNYKYQCTYKFQYYTDENSDLVTVYTHSEYNPNVNYGFHATQAGTYHFKVVASYDGTSYTATSSEVTVSVVNPRVSIAASEETVEAGSNIELTATPEYGTPTTYTFLYSDDGGESYSQLTEGSSSNATYMPTQAGTYLFKVITSDGTHIAYSDPVEVTATEVDPYVIFSVTPTTTNTKGTIVLTAVPVCCKPTEYYFRRVSGSTAMLINDNDLTSNLFTYVQHDPGTFRFKVTAYYDNKEKSVEATSGDITVSPMAQGDVNEDEKVSIADVALLVDILQKKRPTVYGADVNRDGSVNNDDVKALVNLILYGTLDDPNSIDYEGSNTGDDAPKEAETKGENF